MFVVAKVAMLLVAMCGGLTHVPRESLTDRTVTVRVCVTAKDGSLPSNVVALVSAGRKPVGAVLNASGCADVTVEVAEGLDQLIVDLPVGAMIGVAVPGIVPAVWEVAGGELNKRFAVPLPKRVALGPSQNEYSVNYVLAPAVTLTGAMKGPGGEDVTEFLVQRVHDRVVIGRVPLDNKFRVQGIERGKATWLFVWAFNESQVKIIFRNANETVADANIGDIVLTSLPLDATVRLSATGLSETLDDEGERSGRMSLINPGQEVAFELSINADGRVTWPRGVAADPKVSAGEYYVVPGTLVNSASVHKVLRLLAAGRRADVERAGVPLIRAVSGTVNSLTVNVADVVSRIDGIAE